MASSITLGLVVTLMTVSLALATFEPAMQGECPKTMSPEALQAARLAATEAYVTRLNYDLDHYSRVCDRYYTDDARFVLRGIGSFDPLQVAKEYGFVLFNISRDMFQGKLAATLDRPTIAWSGGPANNTVTFWQTATVELGPVYGSTPPKFQFASGGIRNLESLIFAPCSDRIAVDIVVSDRAIMPIYTAHNEIDVVSLCRNIMTRCTGRLQQYQSMAQCVAFMQTLDARQAARPEAACPYRLTSNSTTCRSFHSTNALVDPAVHCPHVAVDSAMCRDTCLPACADCPPHAHCTATYANATAETADYACACDDGFVAIASSVNGATECRPRTCASDDQCHAPFGLCDAATGRCGCQPTFVWDSTTGSCVCPADYELTWDVPRANPSGLGGPACRPPGGCLAREHCTAQEWNQAQCAATTPANTVSPWLACQCNPGFVGGWTSACECPHGPERALWSSRVEGEVCLAPGQCTDDWHCEGASTTGKAKCELPPGSITGKCA
ncbi:zinc finger protein [Acanthamoeba castellanii str. Neff]|uniref:Zinc finger protein n=1 Tax=Acanthamoeba castellanii (strain ATCC 30010 / Neff) TaxID=1257118 RepID=L8HHX8_ACACF|nr:zinc finger protein [Acanthamoeba castellanii str. Neff]ELR24817.1 zinc finger protein [Acanthamoeba castellanii str. Neff]